MHNTTNIPETESNRQNWMALLAQADPADLEAARRQLDDKVSFTLITPPETGLFMVQCKKDGSGSRFNLGEVTVSKCILEVNGTWQGAAWVMGSNPRHAKLAALFDGLLQDPDYHDRIKTGLLKVLLKKEKIRDDQLNQAARASRMGRSSQAEPLRGSSS
ncbi:phosphonate C-P lyase system protein PhnG [Desulfocicer niacini]